MTITYRFSPRLAAIRQERNGEGKLCLKFDIRQLAKLSEEYEAGRMDLKTFSEGLVGPTTNDESDSARLPPEYLEGLSILASRRDLGHWSREDGYLFGAVSGVIDFMVIQVGERRFSWAYIIVADDSYSDDSAYDFFDSEMGAIIDLVQNLTPEVLELIGEQDSQTASAIGDEDQQDY